MSSSVPLSKSSSSATPPEGPAPGSAQAPARIHVRWMIRRDMPEVLAIEHAGFPRPWSEEDFLRVMRQRTCIGMVADRNDKIVAYMIYDWQKNRLTLMRFGVHPELRRAGVGSQLLAKLTAKADLHRQYRIHKTVREGNLPAQLFLRSRGFQAVRVMRGHFEDTGEDAYLFEYKGNDGG